MELIASVVYAEDAAATTLWPKIAATFSNTEGVCYYKDTLLKSTAGAIPEFVAYSRDSQPVIVQCVTQTLQDIVAIEKGHWVVLDREIDSPLWALEDYRESLLAKLRAERLLRGRDWSPVCALALPLISKTDFATKFGAAALTGEFETIWADSDTTALRKPLGSRLDAVEWRLLQSISQGVRPLRVGVGRSEATGKHLLGDAIREIENQIALLDKEQLNAAKNVAPGIQRIRGLAGTGKTVLLAMRAAEIHQREPEKKILFTFNTQSLYNQARNLITKFYRFRAEVDPDWDRVHIRHAWGGRNRPGVYYDLAKRQGVAPLSLNDVRRGGYPKVPFQLACESALTRPILPEYDYVLVDEAQDFPNAFFQVLRRLAFPPYRICYAYDELQSLYSMDLPDPIEMFGRDSHGNPIVSFDGEDYPGGIEKEFVLHKSYRCPQRVLMLAHAIGLGLYSPTGCVQMLEDEESWKAIGYSLINGTLEKGKQVEVFRPPSNSPNQIERVYTGKTPLIEALPFESREQELVWVADSIHDMVSRERVPLDQIIVISLDARLARDYMARIQLLLYEKGIASSIPGLIDDTAAFMEPERVTLSTVYRAKGNEAPLVYIISFDSIYDYVEIVEARNRAFTSISRSKAFIRITGSGKRMASAIDEINRIRADFPYFRFEFPDIDVIRRLDAETAKRRRSLERGKSTIASLLNMDPQVLEALIASDPTLAQELRKKLSGNGDEDK